MKTYKECCTEVAKKYNLGTKLLTGHKATYFKEAALMFTNECLESLKQDESGHMQSMNEYIHNFIFNKKICNLINKIK